MERIKALYCVNSLGIGGITTFVMNTLRQIDKDRFQVDFVVFEDRLDLYDEVRAMGSEVYLEPKTKKKGYAKWVHECCFVYRILTEHHYDIIHCHSCAFKWLLHGVLPALRVKHTKIIAHSHGVGTPKGTVADTLLRCGLKVLLSQSIDLGFACSVPAGNSKYTKSFMRSRKYHIINNAVDVANYQYDENLGKQLRVGLKVDREIVVGSVGRLEREKNYSFLLDIISVLRRQNVNVKLLLIGDGSLRQELCRKAQELEVEDVVIFAGIQSDLKHFYSAMDVFVLPSLYEGFPFTAVEAQANGLKCVMSDTITASVNISGDVVFLSLKDSLSLWAENILNCAGSRSTTEKTQRVLEDYNIVNETQRMEKIYEGLVYGAL